MAGYIALQDRAYEYLKQRIMNGEMERGVIYSETRMAAEIGISRTPMKDALNRLSQDRYIDILPSKGFCLHILSNEDIVSTFQVRTAVEGFCALNLHNERHTPEGQAALASMEASIYEMEQSLAANEGNDALLSHDMNYHQILVRFTNNAELMRLFESYFHRLYDIAYKNLEVPGRAQSAIAEHWQIYKDLCSDDEMATLRLYSDVMQHMTASRDNVLMNQ